MHLSFHPELMQKYLSHFALIGGRRYWNFDDVKSYCRAVMEEKS